jgi:hypothetical protein
MELVPIVRDRVLVASVEVPELLVAHQRFQFLAGCLLEN